LIDFILLKFNSLLTNILQLTYQQLWEKIPFAKI